MENDRTCGVLELYDLFGKKWTYSLFYNLSDMPQTFNQLDKMSKRGVNPSLLSNRLKKLVELGLIKREVLGRNTCYSITPRGLKLKTILDELKTLTDGLDCYIPEECRGKDCSNCKGFRKEK